MPSLDDRISRLRVVIGDIPWEDLETFILTNSHIWRPLRGHAFERWFVKVMKTWGFDVIHKGGDDVVDMILNSKTLQLKTPYINGTKEGERVAYCLHKTHGLEKRPHNLYKRNSFADFLVGRHPEKGVIICPRDDIPLNKDYRGRKWPDYLADPVYFDWNTPWLNRFDLLGINKTYENIPRFETYLKNKFFPKIGAQTQLTDEEIIETLLAPENFRVLEQNLRGSIREWYFKKYADKKGIKLRDGKNDISRRHRIKVDWINEKGKRIQVKGITRNISNFPIVGVEVKGSHGRIPQRLYKKDDFDYLVVVLDPYIFSDEKIKIRNKQPGYNFLVIPAEDLPIHERSKTWGSKYLKDIVKLDLRKFVLNDLSLLR